MPELHAATLALIVLAASYMLLREYFGGRYEQ